jgi:hypothetical protein
MPKKTHEPIQRSLLALFLWFLGAGAWAQNIVTGKILGKTDDLPVSGATIQLKGTKLSAVSGDDGSFALSVTASKGVIVISHEGFDNQEIPFQGAANLGTIILVASSTTLNEVFVTGYTSQRKKDITGSVAIVNVGDMKQTPS